MLMYVGMYIHTWIHAYIWVYLHKYLKDYNKIFRDHSIPKIAVCLVMFSIIVIKHHDQVYCGEKRVPSS